MYSNLVNFYFNYLYTKRLGTHIIFLLDNVDIIAVQGSYNVITFLNLMYVSVIYLLHLHFVYVGTTHNNLCEIIIELR